MDARTLLGFFGLLLISACGPPEPIRIGLVGTLSGRYADFYTASRNGAQLAVDARNQAGGLNGRPIELLMLDTRQDTADGLQAIDELLRAKVSAIVAATHSGMAVAIAPRISEARVLTVGMATSTQLSGRDDYFYRVVASTDVYARFMAGQNHDNQSRRRTAIVYDRANRDYAEVYARHYEERFVALGGKVVARVDLDSTRERNYPELVRALLKGKPDNVLLVCGSIDAALIAQTVRQRDRTVQLSGTEFAASGRLLELGGAATEGMLIEQSSDRFDESRRYLEFRISYRDRFGVEPGASAIFGYDAAQVVLGALERDPGASDLKAALASLGPIPGLQEDIVFDQYGDVERKLHLFVVRNGELVSLR